ncbi:MAG: CRP/FNR family transcriptional regulator [Vicingaceae bacterium]|jgi:CRP/FNR family transcriptional regulator
MVDHYLDRFRGVFEEELLNEIKEQGVIKSFETNDVIMEIGSLIRSMPLLLSGVVKILREDENGDELLLYYLEQGESCAMTLNSCMRKAQSEIRAIAETKVDILFLPLIKMEDWSAKYKSWRDFVFDSYHQRFSELLETIDHIAFLNMEERILNLLKKKSEVRNVLEISQTHQDIANDLNTSRVVVSRLLKKLEIDGFIELHRNRIQIL